MIGKTLTHYEIVEKIGAGGMGVVYRARDTRLDRDVAIKVLPPEFSQRVEARARFEREAKSISSLNHPHICTLFDTGEDSGTHFLVMELVDGESLAERLGAGPLSLTEVLNYGAQIADAVDTAHRAGIVHRDLKPGNIMVTRNGVKLLDFGLAKSLDTGEAHAVTAAPTVTSPLTAEGSIVGTMQYMAPEQLEGGDVDARTDVFALGSVLHEMATGQKAFIGKSQASLIAAVLEHDPTPVSSIQPALPSTLDRVVRKCLEKDPDDRWQTARDVSTELGWIADADSHTGAGPAIPASRRIRRRTLVRIGVAGWAAAAVFLAITLVGALRSGSEAPTEPRGPRTYAWPVPDLGDLKISPDGRHIAYTSDDHAYIRRLDEVQARRVSDSFGAYRLNWSPDSDAIVYVTYRGPDQTRLSTGRIRRVSADGGASTTICDHDGVWRVEWGPDGSIYFASSQRTSAKVYRVSAGGGEPELFLDLEEGQGALDDNGLSFLPDGTMLLTITREGGAAIVARTDDRIHVIHAVENGRLYEPRWSETGHIVFGTSDLTSQETVAALPFDPATLSATGDAFVIARDATRVSVSRDGTLVHRAEAVGGPHRLVWVSREGWIQGTIGRAQESIMSPSLSPDGRYVAVRGLDGDTQDVWLHEVNRATKTRLSYGVIHTWRPSWSPDGSQIVYQSRDGTKWWFSDLWIQDTDGRSAPRPFVQTAGDEYGPNWSPDGEHVIYTVTKEDGDRDIWVVSVEEGAEPRPIVATPFRESMPYFSPDGRHVAYQCDRTGRSEIFVTTFPSADRQWQISSDGGSYAQWGDREIIYVESDSGTLMSVEVTTSPGFAADEPVRLFSEDESGVELVSGGTFLFAPGPDRERFIAVQDLSQEPNGKIVVVENWAAAWRTGGLRP